MPDEGCHIIIYRPLHSALKIDETRIAVLDHHVPCLEVAIHESICIYRCKIICQSLKIVLKPVLIELKTGRLQKAVFEIIKIEKHKPSVELTYRMADGEIKIFRPFELDVRKMSYSPAQKFFCTL